MRSIRSLGPLALPEIARRIGKLKGEIIQANRANKPGTAEVALNEMCHLARALGGIGHPASLQLLKTLVKYPNTNVNRAAVKSIFEHSSAKVPEIKKDFSTADEARMLLGQISVTDRDPAVRAYATRFIAQLGERSVLGIQLSREGKPASVDNQISLLRDIARDESQARKFRINNLKYAITDPNRLKGEEGREIVRNAAGWIGVLFAEGIRQERMAPSETARIIKQEILPALKTKEDKKLVLETILKNAAREISPKSNAAEEFRTICKQNGVIIPFEISVAAGKTKSGGGKQRLTLDERKIKREADKRFRQTLSGSQGKKVGGPGTRGYQTKPKEKGRKKGRK